MDAVRGRGDEIRGCEGRVREGTRHVGNNGRKFDEREWRGERGCGCLVM